MAEPDLYGHSRRRMSRTAPQIGYAAAVRKTLRFFAGFRAMHNSIRDTPAANENRRDIYSSSRKRYPVACEP